MVHNHILGGIHCDEIFADAGAFQGLNDAAMRSAYGAQASDNLSYLKNPIWWAGMVTSACSLLFNCCVLTMPQCSGLG
jgi:hypothetical protein